jgi:hypothetical protein
MKLDGREFSGVEHKITAGQNDYLTGHLRVAGALEVLERFKSSPDNAREDLITRIYRSGEKPFVIAGLLTETGKKWSRLEADRNAARFDQITDPADLELMTAVVVRAVIDFFEYAEISSRTPNSSSPNAEVPATESAEPTTPANVQ